MTFGFRIRDAVTGQLRMTSEDLGLLFLDQFLVTPGVTSRTYSGVSLSEVKVIRLGANSFGGEESVSLVAVDGGVGLTVNSKVMGWYIVSRE